MTPHTPVEGLVAIAARLRNLSRIMAGGDGTKRLDTPAWEHAAKIADELEALASLPVEGWVLVPRAPTPEMREAYEYWNGRPRSRGLGPVRELSANAYAAMIAAAPQDQRQGNEQGGTHE